MEGGRRGLQVETPKSPVGRKHVGDERAAEAVLSFLRGTKVSIVARVVFGANCGTTVGLAMDGPTSTVGPPFLAMHKGHIFG